MQTYLAKPKPPTDDKRWRLVDATMRRYGQESRALIETLHTVQETFGCLDMDSLKYVAGSLKVPLSRAYGVATFYHYFTLKPPGDHTCVICMGTACYIKGAGHIMEAFDTAFGIKAGETTPDGSLSLLTVRCLGSCGLAPAVIIDGTVIGKMNPSGVVKKVREEVTHDA